MSGRKIVAGVAAVAAAAGLAVGWVGVSTAHDDASRWSDDDAFEEVSEKT